MLHLALLLQLLLLLRLLLFVRSVLLRLGLCGQHRRLSLRCLTRLGGCECLQWSSGVAATTPLLALLLRWLLLRWLRLQWLLLAAACLAGN